MRQAVQPVICEEFGSGDLRGKQDQADDEREPRPQADLPPDLRPLLRRQFGDCRDRLVGGVLCKAEQGGGRGAQRSGERLDQPEVGEVQARFP